MQPSDPTARNSLVAAANPLLDLLAQIRTSTALAPERLRDYLVDQIRQFQSRAQQAGIAVETIVGARYCLCTTLDEAAALAPWGGGGVWSTHSLLVAFHNETWGGEKFFQLLARLSASPREHRHLLELQYFCLVLGFQGRYRVTENGAAQLETLTRRLHKLLHEIGRGYGQALSPAWQADDRASAVAMRRGWPMWIWLPSACASAVAGYIGFASILGAHADRTDAAINAMRLPDVGGLAQGTSTTLQQRLAADLRSGALAVRGEADRDVIAMRGDALFDSGSAVANRALLPVLARVANALNQLDGEIVITGHTDNQPIRDRHFASNLALSQARAAAVAQWLRAAGLDPSRTLSAVGRGDAEPVDSNLTAVGRAHNRRVEIVVFPVGQDRQNLSQATPR